MNNLHKDIIRYLTAADTAVSWAEFPPAAPIWMPNSPGCYTYNPPPCLWPVKAVKA